MSRQPAGENEVSERVRRPVDLLMAALGILAAATLLGIAHGLPLGTSEATDDVNRWVAQHIPRSIAYPVGSVADLGALGWLLVATVHLARRAPRDALNAASGALLGAGVSTGLVLFWRGHAGGGVALAMVHSTNPAALVVTVAFTAFVTGTDLARLPRWGRWCGFCVLGLLCGEFVLGDLTLFGALGAPVFGWSAGLAARWAFGAASVRPSAGALGHWLGAHGVHLDNLEPVRGRMDFVARGEGGSVVEVALANRDTRGAGLLRQLWHAARLQRAVTGAEALSSRAQLEGQALASYVAVAAGIVAPRVRLLAEYPPETLVLCVERPEGKPPTGETSVDDLAGVFGALRSLHRAGVAHRDLRSEHLVVGGEGPGFSSIEKAQTAAGELLRRIDVAQLLTTVALLAGPQSAVKAFRQGYEPENEAGVAAVLQPVALATWGWSSVRRATACLSTVRRELAGESADRVPQRLERFRLRTVLSAVALTVAAFLLIGQLSRVNLLGALGDMNPGWFLVAVAASALTYLAAAINLAAFVPARLSMVRGFLVQLSSAFVGVAMPPTVGHLAVNGRYLHRQGVDDGAVGAAIAVSQMVNVATTIPLLVVIGALTGSGVSRFHIVPGTNLLIGLAAIVALVGVLMAIPRPRRLVTANVWPKIRSAIPHLVEAVSQPVRLAVGVGANLLLTLSYVVALLASLWALGAHPPLLGTAAVYLAANTVGSIVPTPGGLGAVEAVMSAGLTAIGIPTHEALPAVLVFRSATFWLPIPSGWVAYLALQRTGTL